MVLHPPFRWQRDYARDFVDGVALREHETGIALAVENMFPWRGRATARCSPTCRTGTRCRQPYDHVTLDLSHTATAGSDAMEMAATLGPAAARTCTSPTASAPPRTSTWCPGAARSRAPRCSRRLRAAVLRGIVVVEVGTRRRSGSEREADLAEALAFARLHLAAAPA